RLRFPIVSSSFLALMIDQNPESKADRHGIPVVQREALASSVVCLFILVPPQQLMSVTRDGPLFILTMLDNENRFTKEFCGGICDALDYVSDIVDKEDLKEAALITRGGAEKFYSNGLHFEKALAIPNFPEDIFMPMLHKILMFSLPTVACING
ncbi:hypothetical protein BX616_007006, partial [Lobosporangium transversale]